MSRLDDELTAVVYYALTHGYPLAAKAISRWQAKVEKAARPKRRRKVRLGKGGRKVAAGEFYIEPGRLEEVSGE